MTSPQPDRNPRACRLEEGRAALAAGDFPAARRAFTAALGDAALDPLLFGPLARCAAAAGDFPAAAHYARAHLNAGFQDADDLEFAAAHCAMSGDYDQARALYRRAQEQAPTGSRSAARLAAERHFVETLAARRAPPAAAIERAHTRQAEAALADGDFARAARLIAHAEASGVVTARRHGVQGACALAAGRLDEAEAQLAAARALDGEDEIALAALAELHARRQRPAEAQALIAQARAAHPDSLPVLLGAAARAFEAGQPAAAEAALRAACTAHPDDDRPMERLVQMGRVPDPSAGSGLTLAKLHAREARRRVPRAAALSAQARARGGEVHEGARFRLSCCDAGALLEDRFLPDQYRVFHECALAGRLTADELDAVLAAVHALRARLADSALTLFRLRAGFGDAHYEYHWRRSPGIEPAVSGAAPAGATEFGRWRDDAAPDYLVLELDGEERQAVSVLGLEHLRGCYALVPTGAGDYAYASDVGVT